LNSAGDTRVANPVDFLLDMRAHTLIRDVPDFPKPGILFKDITPVLENGEAFREVIDLLTADAESQGAETIVGIESRGFMFGAPIAYNLGLPFVVARKLGKLPYDRISEEYALEYGTNTVEMHIDSVKKGQKAYIVDDLLATGGTAAATARLVERLGGEVCGFGFLIRLTFLDGEKVLSSYHQKALMEF
jgi:adenine phosphoribosyltransferase